MGLEQSSRQFIVPRPNEIRLRKEKLQPPKLERAVHDPREMISQLCEIETGAIESLDLLDQIMDKAERDELLHDALRTELEARLGNKFGPKILDSWEYRLAVRETAEILDKTMSDSEKPVCSERGLRAIIAVHEIFGDQAKELITAADMRQYVSEEISFNENNLDDGFLSCDAINFDEITGELTASIYLGDNFSLVNDDILSLHKKFDRRPLPTETGKEQQYERVLTYDSFSIPEHIQSKGCAAKELAASMKPAMEAGIDRLALHANISIGGYAWASYGFGWDTRRTAEIMVNAYIDDQKKRKKEGLEPATEGDVAEVVPSITSSADLSKDQIAELAQRYISTFVYARRNVMSRLLVDAGLMKKGEKPPSEFADVWQELRDMEAHPETATPQRIAGLGHSLSLRISPEELKPSLPSHLGKAAMIWSSWYGTIDLSTDNDHRKILLEKLAQATSI